MLAVGTLAIALGAGGELVAGDPAVAEGDLFRGGDGHALILLEHADEAGRAAQTVHRAGVHPGKAAAEELCVQTALLKVHVVERRDLKFAAGGGLHGSSHVTHPGRVEVQPDYSLYLFF